MRLSSSRVGTRQHATSPTEEYASQPRMLRLGMVDEFLTPIID